MIELLINVGFGLILSLVLGFYMSVCGKFLDDAMDYGGIFWNIRYRLAFRYTDNIGKFGLRKSLAITKLTDYENQPAILRTKYQEIAAKNPKFTRWICRVCMTVFLSLFPVGIISVLLFIFGFPLVSIAAFLLAAPISTYYYS